MTPSNPSSGSKAVQAPLAAPSIVSERTSSARLTRNATLNLFTEAILFVVLVVAMPPLVSHLGVQAFGLYALAWSVIGYLAYLELGVSRSATQFVSKYLSQENDTGVRQAATTAILSNLSIGIVSSVVIVLLTPLLTQMIFHIPLELRGQAKLVFYSVALAVPMVMLQAVFRAIAASYQEFGVINIVNTVGTSVQFALACYLAWQGFGVGAVVFSTVAVRMGLAFSYGVLVFGLDALVLFWIAERYCGCSMRFLRGPSALRILLLGMVLLLVSIVIQQVVTNPWLGLSMGLLGVASYFFLVWHFLLNSRKRPAVMQALGFSRSLKIV